MNAIGGYLLEVAERGAQPPATRSFAYRAVVRLSKWTPAALAVGSLSLGVYALLRIRREWSDLQHSAGQVGALLILGALTAVAVCNAWAMARLFRRTAGLSASSWRWSICWWVVAWIVWLIVFPTLHQLSLEIYAAMACGLWTIAASWARRPRGRWSRRFEAVAWNLCLTAVGVEAGFHAAAALFPSPMFSRVDAEAAEKIARFKFPPGSRMFGYAFNTQGFYDEPFEQLAQGRRRIAVVSDSFGVGVVPHPVHFTTVCETKLENVDVLNLGVAGIGPGEYAHLVREEAKTLDPDAIVVCLFIGNDVVEAPVDRKRLAALRTWLERDRLFSVVVLGRLTRWSTHWQGGAYWAPAAPCDPPPCGVALKSLFPWLADPDLEQPTLTASMHLQIETERAAAVCGPDRRRYAHLFESLERIIQAADGVPIAFCLIPDEFQIDDELWRTIESRSPGVALDRGQPQRLLAEWLRGRNIACLDLLGPLRSAASSPKGRRRLYHRQDTHFNAQGNKVAGEELAEFVGRAFGSQSGNRFSGRP